MHAAGAGVHRDKISRQDDRGAGQKRMLRADAFELVAGKRLQRFANRLPAGRGANGSDQFLRQHECLRVLATREFLRDVTLFRMHGDGEIRRQRPRRRRPDDDARLAREIAGHDRKLHVNRGVFAVLIFHFRLGQGGLRAGAPEDRLHAFVNETFLDEDREGAKDLRFVGRVQRQVGMLPIAERRRAA